MRNLNRKGITYIGNKENSENSLLIIRSEKLTPTRPQQRRKKLAVFCIYFSAFGDTAA